MSKLLSVKSVAELAFVVDRDTNSAVACVDDVGTPDGDILATDASGQEWLVTIVEAHAGRVRLLELQAAVGARAGNQRPRAAARRARVAAEIDRRGAVAREHVAPVAAQDLRDLRQLVLLDQEVRLGPSTFAGAGRTADDRGDAGGEAAIAQRLHLGDRAGDHGHQREPVEQLIRFSG